MQFITLRHTFTMADTVGENPAKIHCGPYGGYSTLSEDDLAAKHAAMRMCTGVQNSFSKEHEWDSCYGFLNWDQFYAYWGDNDLMYAWWERGNFAVLEYDIPEEDVLFDATQAVAPIWKYEPITSYNFCDEMLDSEAEGW